MFNKLKQYKDLHAQAKKLQEELGQMVVSENKNGVTITMDGNLSLKSVEISEEMLSAGNKKKLEETLAELHSDALKKIQRNMALKMKEMGGLPNIPGLG